MDTGDFIVVVNVDKLRVTGNKAQDKILPSLRLPGRYLRNQLHQAQQRFPERVLEEGGEGHAAEGPLGYAMLKKLKCYAGRRIRTAQQPQVLEI